MAGIVAALARTRPRGAGRRAGVPAGRGRDPRCGRRRPRCLCAGRGPDRGTPPLRAPVVGRSAPRVRALAGRGCATPGHSRDERRRDEPHRARHPLRDRRRHGPDVPLQQPRRRCSACRSRPCRRRRRSSVPAARAARAPASRSGSTPPTTSPSAPSSPNPRSCGRAWPRSSCRCSRSASATSRRSPSSPRPTRAGVKAALDLLGELGAVEPGRGRPAAHPHRTRHRAHADRPPLRPHAHRGAAHRRARRGAADRGGHVDPGRPRETRRAPRGGRPAARALRRPDERLPRAAQSLEPPARGSSASSDRARSGASAAPSTSTTCACASGSTCTGSCVAALGSKLAGDDRSTGQGPGGPGARRSERPRRDPPRAPLRPALAHRHPRRAQPPGKGATPARRGRRLREYLGARGIRFAIFPGSGLRKERPQAVMAAETRRDLAAVRPHGRRDRPRLGRAPRGRPGEAPGQRAALVEGCRRRRRLREGHPVRGRDHPAPPRAVRADRPGRRSRELFVRHALVEGEWDPSTHRQAA